MERISSSLDIVQQQPEELSLLTRSGVQLPEQSVMALGIMMAQMQAFFPNQVLPKGTPDMWLKAWMELVIRYGLENFRDGLWKACNKSDFLPSPKAIREECSAIFQLQESRRALDQSNAESKHRKDHPEEYFSFAELVDEFFAKRKVGTNETV